MARDPYHVWEHVESQKHKCTTHLKMTLGGVGTTQKSRGRQGGTLGTTAPCLSLHSLGHRPFHRGKPGEGTRCRGPWAWGQPEAGAGRPGVRG